MRNYEGLLDDTFAAEVLTLEIIFKNNQPVVSSILNFVIQLW